MIKDIAILLEILTCLYGISASFNTKMRYNIYAVILIIAETILLMGINQYGFPTYLVSLSYLLIFIYCLINYKDSLIKTAINCIITVVLISIVQVVCYMPVSYIPSINKTIRGLLVSAMSLIIFIFGAPKMRLKEISDLLLKRKILLWIVGIFVFLVWGSQLWKIKRNGVIYGKDYIPIVYFVALIFLMLWQWQKTRIEVEREKSLLEMNVLYYEAYENLIQSVREKQHDLKNHINAICGMIYTVDNYEELVEKQKDYIDNVLRNVEKVPILTLIENPLLSGFLIQKIHEAENKGIEVEQKCTFTAKELKVPEYKIVEMMGILFDNAIEETVRSDCDKKIKISLFDENDVLYFSISNISSAKIQDASKLFAGGYSTKGENRGIGLLKLKKMLEQEKGEIHIEQEEICENHFWITFRIQIYI